MPNDPHRPRSRIPFRVGLGFLVGLLLATTITAMASVTYLTTRTALIEITNRRIHDLLVAFGLRVTNHVHRAVPVVELAQTLVGDQLLRSDRQSLLQLFITLLETHPDLSWASYSSEDGDFTGAYRTEQGGVLPSLSSPPSASAAVRPPAPLATGSHPGSVRPAEEGYDPRNELFYESAKRTGRRTWVGPYVFYDEGIPGVTCASPRFAPDGRLLGVFTTDFNLNVLSSFVSQLQFGARGRVFVMTEAGTMLAYPNLRLAEKLGQRSGGKLVGVTDVGDPVLPAFYAALKSRESGPPPATGRALADQFPLVYAGERYLAGYQKVEIDEGVSWIVGAVAPEADFLAPLIEQRRDALVIAATVLTLGLLLTWVIARRVSAALLRLAGEMEQVGSFRLVTRPFIPTIFREVSIMDVALTNMKNSLRSFGYYVPKDLVRSILASGREATLQGESREMTIFFADIRDFTSTAEAMRPDDLVHQLSRYLDEMTQVTTESGGTVDKYIGDAIMAFWGAPVEMPDHAARACEAALASQRRLAAMRNRAETPWLQGLEARIGVATGRVVVGNVGSPERFNYTVIGDAVNLASRLEGLNKSYGTPILISESTHLAARERIIARPIDVVQVKGKRNGVVIYEPLALATESDDDVRELARCFEEALSAYLERDFERAASCFEHAVTLRPGDRPSEILLARCRRYLSSPPPPDWNGIHVVTEK